MTSVTISTGESKIADSQLNLVPLAVPNRPSGDHAWPYALRATTKATRRQGKRDGPVQFRFVTATNPSQFKDGDTRRIIRSQAMKHHRNQPNIKNAAPRPRPGTEIPHDSRPIVTERTKPATAVQSSNPTPPCVAFGALVYYSDEQQTGIHPFTRTRSPIDASGAQHQDVDFEESGSTQSSRNTSSCSPDSKDIEKLVDYDYTESQQERKIRLLATTFSRIGDGVDPFIVLPQFENPKLNSVFLLRNCMRAFGTEAYVKEWVPGMLSHPHILLSTGFLACNWLDMIAKLPGESTRTRLVRDEILVMLRLRRQSFSPQNAVSTLVVILHLMGGEVWSCDEPTVRCHEEGVEQMILLCGGMDKLGKVILAQVSAACCFQCNLVYEAKPLPTFARWEPAKYTAANEDVAIPESPLFCPRRDFVTVPSDKHCSPTTCDLLRDMRDLTDLFLAHNTTPEAPSNIGDAHAVYMRSTDTYYKTRVAGIRDRLMNLPSAYIPDHPGACDWVYEACRLTAMIYTASIIRSLPFSIAADPSRNPFCATAGASEDSHDNQISPTTHLSEELMQTLERTDLANVWSGMAGVLYWICTVGAAAARSPAVSSPSQRFPHRKTCKFRVRQCLTMFSIRALVVLVFKHPTPILISQKRLLRVQELIGTHD